MVSYSQTYIPVLLSGNLSKIVEYAPKPICTWEILFFCQFWVPFLNYCGWSFKW